jgi:hypothetical protein
MSHYIKFGTFEIGSRPIEITPLARHVYDSTQWDHVRNDKDIDQYYLAVMVIETSV